MYNYYNRSFGVPNANRQVSIVSYSSGLPAVILASPSGGMVSNTGIVDLDSSGNLSVVIDTSQTWVVTVLGQSSISQNAVSSVVEIRKSELLQIAGQVGTMYITDNVPREYYLWDGLAMVQIPSFNQSSRLKFLSDPSILDITYNLSGKVISYTKQGIIHNVNYSQPDRIVISNTTGASKTFILNNLGKVTSFY